MQSDAVTGWSGLWRWIVGSVVLVPVLLAAGVYWLHQLPAGPLVDRGNAVMHVALVRTPEPAIESRPVSMPSHPPIADFDAAPAIPQETPPSFEKPIAPPSPPKSAPPGSAQPQALASPGATRAPQPGAALRYQRLLLAHIERYQHYPRAARRDGVQGTVVIAFAMRRDGRLLTVGVKSSSGQAVLDEEAVETVRRAQPLPSIPPDLPEQLAITLPVAFDLQ